MKRLAIALSIFVGCGVGIAAAQEDPIKLRQSHFKEMAAAVREPGGMLRGQVPFDIAKVHAALDKIADVAEKNVKLFPNTPTVGVETEALPVIWERKSDFEALFLKLGGDAKAAKASIKDEAGFKTEFPKVLGNCGVCHNTFRVKRS